APPPTRPGPRLACSTARSHSDGISARSTDGDRTSWLQSSSSISHKYFCLAPISFRASLRGSSVFFCFCSPWEWPLPGRSCASTRMPTGDWASAPPSSAASPGSARRSYICCSAAQLLAAPPSEEHTSELQSRSDLVCRLLL